MKEIKLPHDHTHGKGYDFENMPAVEDFEVVATIFKLLSDPTRARLFWLLCHCEECVLDLSVMMGASSPAISHHLKLLRDSGLIVSRRDGKEVYYKASECERAQALHRMIEQVESISCRNITADVGGAGHSHAESKRNVVRRRIR